MKYVSIVGTGFVADLYMRSLALYDDIAVRGVYDLDPDRLDKFTRYWNVRSVGKLDALIEQGERDDILLNLTNPGSHFDVSYACLRAGRHVYSEKPLAMEMAQAETLYETAKKQNVLLASAPCSVLGESCQTLWRAVREEKIGKPLLVYAELDDGFISQAPYRKWQSVSGARWPYEDEFKIGCTIEHAGYYLTWLTAIFGPVRKVVAASAELDRGKLGGIATAPDFSVAVLYFDNGVVARLTCSIVARHNHSLRVIGEEGTLELDECWDNEAPVRVRRRRSIKRRLVEMPISRRLRLTGPTHRKVKRAGAAAMNFALGPVEMLDAIAEKRACRLSAELALHLNEVTLAIQNAANTAGAMVMKTECPPMEPAEWAEDGIR